MRNLGLIGGLGPIATVHYYQELAEAGAGEMVIVHADRHRVLHDVQRNDLAGLAAYFACLIERLAKSGADVAAISAVTPHICFRELQAISALPLVNIVEHVDREIRARGYKRVALFGTRFVVESRMFGMLRQAEIVVPHQVQEIDRAYMGAVNGSTEGRAVLSRIARELPVDAVVLAGTDFAPMFNEANTDFAHIDCARIHIRAILEELR